MEKNPSPMTHSPSPASNHPSVAVIGSGYWGKNLVRNFHQLGVLKTICDGAQPIREEMSKTYPDVFITANVSDVLKDNDMVTFKSVYMGLHKKDLIQGDVPRTGLEPFLE